MSYDELISKLKESKAIPRMVNDLSDLIVKTALEFATEVNETEVGIDALKAEYFASWISLSCIEQIASNIRAFESGLIAEASKSKTRREGRELG